MQLARYAVKRVLSFLFRDHFVFFRDPAAGDRLMLTFDDGPHPVVTPLLLDILHKNGVRATFFVSGSQAEHYPEIVREIRKQGHIVGNHSFRHARIAETGTSAYCAAIQKTADAVRNILHEEACLYRSPYGEMTLPLIGYLIRNRLKYVGWTVDSGDSFIKDSVALARSLSERDIRGGDILLFHDDEKHTAEAMPSILSNLKARGFTFITVPVSAAGQKRGNAKKCQ